MKFALPPDNGSSEVDAYFVPLSHSKTSDLISSAVSGAAISSSSCGLLISAG
jgi:hypothetical protein